MQTIALKLTGFAATMGQETLLHPSQRVKVHRDGSVTLTIRDSNTRDYLMWALARGPEVEVLRPSNLRNTMRLRLRAALAQYRR